MVPLSCTLFACVTSFRAAGEVTRKPVFRPVPKRFARIAVRNLQRRSENQISVAVESTHLIMMTDRMKGPECHIVANHCPHQLLWRHDTLVPRYQRLKKDTRISCFPETSFRHGCPIPSRKLGYLGPRSASSTGRFHVENRQTHYSGGDCELASAINLCGHKPVDGHGFLTVDHGLCSRKLAVEPTLANTFAGHGRCWYGD